MYMQCIFGSRDSEGFRGACVWQSMQSQPVYVHLSPCPNPTFRPCTKYTRSPNFLHNYSIDHVWNLRPIGWTELMSTGQCIRALQVEDGARRGKRRVPAWGFLFLHVVISQFGPPSSLKILNSNLAFQVIMKVFWSN